MTKYLLISCVLFLTACSSVPKKLELPENTNSVDFSKAQSTETNFVGQKARWGGVIASIQNNAETTMLEIVNFPLTGNLKPKKGDETLGRFRVYFNGLLDPVIYKAGRSITAVGTISEFENGKIGEHEYNFPVLNDASVHLWKKMQNVNVTAIRQPYWLHNDPYFWSGSRSHYNRPVIIRSSRSSSQPASKSKVSSSKK
ncbi:Slp family lipoprotein [Pseudocolwellia sp. HL-MZ19]|uniref:Slp family lipoprotein n=1 Tax=unclassified Pseudocolwellia TaxID=2848178 RepID=UPI003CEFBFB1